MNDISAYVTLADKITKIRINKIVKILLTVQGISRVCYFYVLNDMTTDIIIGLPSICIIFMMCL